MQPLRDVLDLATKLKLGFISMTPAAIGKAVAHSLNDSPYASDHATVVAAATEAVRQLYGDEGVQQFTSAYNRHAK